MKYFLTLLVSLLAAVSQAQTWTQLADFPGSGRDDGAGFVIGNNFYVGTGLDGGFNAQRDFYVLDLTNETWSTGISLAVGMERQYATSFSDNNYGYLFGGIGPGLNYLQDLQRFDPVLLVWQAMSTLPSAGRRGAAAFVINNEAYIIGGNHPSQVIAREVWKYSIANDSWQQMNDFPFTGLWRAGGCSVNGVGYVLGGIDSSGAYSDKLYAYDPVSDQWTTLSPLPFNGRAYTQLVALGSNPLFFGGHENGNIFKNDLFMYHTLLTAYVPFNPMPALGRRGFVAGVWNNTLYISTGLTSIPARTAEIWKVNGIVGIEDLNPEKLNVYPNPFTESIQLNKNGHLAIFDVQGRKVHEEEVEKGKVNLDFLNAGFYILKLNSFDKKLYSIKIYKVN